MDAFLIFCLMVTAATVAVKLARKKTAWSLIVVYWVILTVKNFINLIQGS